MKVFQKLFVIFLCGMLTLSSQLPVYATEGTTETTPTASGETATVSSSDSENFVTKTNFPDDNFRNYLLQKGIKSKSDVESTTTLDLAGRNIKNLDGIKYFTNLTKLNVKANSLTTLNLSENKKLGWLDASQNNLECIKEGDLPSSLQYLVVTDNILTDIYLKNLENLWYLNVSVNHLSTIDISGNPKLTHLFLFESDYTTYDNTIKILDLSAQEETLYDLIFRKYAHLLDVIITPKNGDTISASLFYSNLESDEGWTLDDEVVDANGSILFNGGTLKKVKLSEVETSKTTESQDTFLSVQNFPDVNFRDALTQLGITTQEKAETVTTLDLAGRNIENLTGIDYFTNLTKLNVKANNLSTLDLSKNTSLGWLDASQNSLECIKANELPSSLKYLVVTDNFLESIDLSNLSELWYLNVSVNKLSTIDLSGNPKLTHLFLFESDYTTYDNTITELDLRNQKELDKYFFEKYAHILKTIVTPESGDTVSASLIYSNLSSDEVWTLNDEVVNSNEDIELNGGILKRVKCSEVSTVNVILYANDGTDNKSEQSAVVNSEVSLKNSFIREGYTFLGWSYTKGSTKVNFEDNDTLTIDTYPSNGKVELYAVWQANTYTIIFHANNGTNETKSQSMIYGVESALIANDFISTGKTFVGWATSSTGEVVYQNKQSVSNLATENSAVIDLYAVWADVAYTISFDLNGGTSSSIDSQTVVHNNKVTKPSNPTRTGYTFTGWVDKSTGKSYSFEDVVTSDITLQATWKANTYTITYNANGGSGSMVSQAFTYNVNSTLSTNSFTRTGYEFAGWSLTPTGSVQYKDNASVINLSSEANKTVILYAQWTPITYTITYQLNGGSVSGNPTSYNVTSDTITLNTPTRNGYTFAGWYSDANYSTKVTQITKGSTGNVTLYAKWTENTYTITYNLDGGSVSGNPPSYTVTSSTITLKNPTKNGYTFAGWYSDSKYSSKVTQIAKGSTGNVTLYAKWTKNTYTITYNLNGGKASGNPSSYTVTSSTITLKNPTKSGYTFAGWYSDSKYSSKVTQITKGSTGNVTLYAKWTANTYKITYKLNGGKVSGNPTSYKVTSSTITLKNPTRSGYTFAGWYSDSKYTKKVTKITKGSTGNRTLYAKWTKVSKPSKVTLNSAKNSSKSKVTVSYKAIIGASGYQIAYSTSSNFTKSTTKYTTSKTISNLKKGKTYYIKVRAYKKDSTGAKIYGSYSKVIKVKITK